MSVLKNTGLHVAFAFVAMGGWAFLANRGHPFPAPLEAAAAQGTMSALLTLFLKRVADGLRGRMTGAAAYLLPPLVASAGSVALLLGGHRLAGTPEVLATVAVPLAVSVPYVFAYNILRARERRA